jgi:alanine-synthesizing transaminase
MTRRPQETNINRYATARAAAERRDDFVDLIRTNFHSCGLRYPADLLAEYARSYYDDEGLRSYRPDPAGDPATRRAIAELNPGGSIDPDHVVVTASASESYSHLFSATCRAGDHVLMPRPCYPLFEEVALRHGLECRFYDHDPGREWSIDLEMVEAIIEPETRVLVLISPDNPTGHIASENEVVALGEICRRHRIVLIHDEVFGAYRYRHGYEAAFARPAELCPDTVVATINGVSKLFAAPDCKVSWIAITGPRNDLVERLRIENDIYLSAAPLNQYLVTRMIGAGEAITRSIVDEVGRRRMTLIDQVAKCNGVTMVPPAGAIHAVLLVAEETLPDKWDDEELAVALLGEGVGTHPGYLYSIQDYTALVVSYLPPPEMINEGMKRLGRFLKRLHRA